MLLSLLLRVLCSKIIFEGGLIHSDWPKIASRANRNFIKLHNLIYNTLRSCDGCILTFHFPVNSWHNWDCLLPRFWQVYSTVYGCERYSDYTLIDVTDMFFVNSRGVIYCCIVVRGINGKCQLKNFILLCLRIYVYTYKRLPI